MNRVHRGAMAPAGIFSACVRRDDIVAYGARRDLT
jgi:hypothetical protein